MVKLTTMKLLRILHVLFYLCALWASAQSDEIDWKNRTVSADPSSSSVELKEPLNINNPRDKRALGLILSGLAQVFGYTVDPVQIAALPNPTAGLDEARATQSPANGSQAPSAPPPPSMSTQMNGSSTTAAPRQRETIRFTGVLNFGNSTGLLNHLQEYERIFHGGNNNSSTMSQPMPMSPTTQAPRMNSGDPNLNQPPFLVKIPLPVMTMPPLPSMPQQPLPEIPPQDIMLSYPAPLVPVRVQQQPDYRRTENRQNMTVESKQIFNGMDVQSRPPPTTYTTYTQDPRWKMEYEERLAELERKQEEQAERLRQQEWHRHRQKDDNYSGEENGKQYDGVEKPIAFGGQDSRCRDEENESFKSNQSGKEEDRSGERIREYATSQRPKESEESEEEEEERYQDYKNGGVSKYNNYEPQIRENYTNIQYGDPLPLTEDDEQQGPGELRNSYGELLHNRELFDDAFADYVGKLKRPLTDFYTSPVLTNPKDESAKEEEYSRDEDEDKSGENVREEDDTPARNKYEEYSLEEDTDTRGKGEKDTTEDSSDTGMKYSNVLTNGKNRSYYEEKKTTEEVDFDKFMPLVVPVRYLSAPEELRKTGSSFPTTEDLAKDNKMFGADNVRKASSKESRRSRKESLKPVVGFPERQTARKLHEGEGKELQAWPPPFDFVLDSTVHTNVVPPRSSRDDNIKVTNIRGKPESSGKTKEETKQQRRRRVTVNNSTQKPHDYPANVSYENFKEDMEQRGVNSGKGFLLNKPGSSKKLNRLRIEVKDSKEEVPDFWKRYKYSSNDNYGITERPSIEIQHSTEERDPDSLYRKKLGSLKRNIQKDEPSKENYYSEIYSGKNKGQINDNNRRSQNPRVIQRKSSTFVPNGQYNYFDVGENAYGLNYGTGNQRLSGVFKDDKKIVNEEAIDLATPQRDVYRYDESLTKFASEPKSKSVKVGGRDYGNGATTMRIIEQEQINSNEPISYIDYSRTL